ncbi:MAG: hypothetical protein ACKVVP_05990 [Chloroflexota bacterium]
MRTYLIVGHQGHIRLAVPEELEQCIHDLLPLGEIEPPPSGSLEVTITVVAPTEESKSYRLLRNGCEVFQTTEWPACLRVAVAEVTSCLVDWLRKDYTVVHAGGVALHGQGILFPAASGRGKSTLVAALVAQGFHYINDDAVGFDPTTGRLVTFPKNIAIKKGSLRWLAPMYPEVVTARSYRWEDETVWYLQPPTTAIPLSPPDLKFIVLPRYTAEGPGILAPLSRSSVLPVLLPQLFEPINGANGAVPAALAMLRVAHCYELAYRDARQAADALRELLEATGPQIQTRGPNTV